MNHRGPLALGLAFTAIVTPATAFAQTADPYTSYTRYDAAGRAVGTISPDPDGSGPLPHLATRTTYDVRGLPILVESGRLKSYKPETILPSAWGTAADDADDFTADSSAATGYDAMRRKVWEKAIGTDGVAVSLTQYSYDNLGRLECTAVRMNPAQYAGIEAAAEAGTIDACTQQPYGSHGPDRISKTVYDAAGQVLQVRVGVDSPIDPGTGESVEAADVTYSYTPNGKIEYLIDANGNRTTYEYDGFDRLIRWNFPDRAGATNYNDSTPATALSSAGSSATIGTTRPDYEEYTYDANGNRLTLRKRDGNTIAYTYDALNRMTIKDLPVVAGVDHWVRRDVYYHYDLRGLQTGVHHVHANGGDKVLTSYDGFGRINQSTTSMGGRTYTLSYGYDANSNRTSITHPDGTTFTYAYDGLDRFKTLAAPGYWLLSNKYHAEGQLYENARNNSVAASWYVPLERFYYDTVGRLSSKTIQNRTTMIQKLDFTRNPASQILTETRDNDAFAWLVENSFERNHAVNGLNQYDSAGTAAFCYDMNGNLRADGTYIYRYDLENRLVQMRSQVNTDCNALIETGTWQAGFAYDPLGRLTLINDGQAAELRTLYDGDALIAEYRNSDNTLLRRYVHGSNLEADDPLVWYEGAGTTASERRYLYADPRGSIVLVTDNTGNAVAINAYDEYGIPTTGPGWYDIATRGRFRYTGQIWLPSLGMYHYKARIYSPTLGRFLQTDPIGYEDQFNLYAYVANDPINAVDPTGMCSSINDETVRADCFEKREVAVEDAKVYLDGESVRSGRDEAAFIATFNEDTGDVTVRTGDEAGVRTDSEVAFTDDNGGQLVARPDGRVVEQSADGSVTDTNQVVLATGHSHPRANSGSITSRGTDRANNSIRRNPNDQALSRVAPAVIKTPSGRVKVFVNGKEIK